MEDFVREIAMKIVDQNSILIKCLVESEYRVEFKADNLHFDLACKLKSDGGDEEDSSP